MASEDALCLENIDEFVHDENKIVTCKWLSLTLKIHVNHAKWLLYTFIQQQKKKGKDVNATYFVAGSSKGDGGNLEHRCLVVSESQLEAVRSSLTSVTSCHVYSVQRATLKDSNSLYMTDYEGVQENLEDCNKYSSIHCQRAAERRSRPSRKVATPAKALGTGKGDAQKPVPGVQSSSGDRAGSGDPPGVGKGKKGEPKGSIASMFAQTAKTKEAAAPKNKESSAAKEASKENKPSNKKGSVMDLFANAKPAKPKAAVEEKKKEAAVEKKKEAAVDKKKEAAVDKKKEVVVSKESKTTEKKGKTTPPARSKTSRAKDDSDCEEQPAKKRRRRIQNDLFDSSSEDEMEILEASPVPSPVAESSPEPDPEPPAPVQKTPEKRGPPCPPSPPQANGSKQRRRRRKLVPKTYLDDDGFMVTEKVWESESTDASEVEEEVKKKAAATEPPHKKKAEPGPPKKASPQKKASPAKGKQTSLMSFFKKK